MNSKTLTKEALTVIDNYLHFKVGAGVCSVPYFNNKTLRSRGALSALVGKGSPKEIFEEAETLVFKNRMKLESVTGESLKKLMTENNIGVDCSALAFHTLNAESRARGDGPLRKKLGFIQAKGLRGFIAAHTHPARLADVATFANDMNSRVVPLAEVTAGDIITMMDGSDTTERNHILIVHQVDTTGSTPTKIHYTHAVAYPEDGLYGSGIKQGEIEITNPSGTLFEQLWKESGSIEAGARIFARAQNSRTELRRLK